MWRRITPANGYCLFFPNRPRDARVVSGRSVLVGPFDQWKHVKVGLFHVNLPADQKLLVVTSEKLECELKAAFGITVGTPGDDLEDRLARATNTCPATRSMADRDRIELVPFFRDWATNHCMMATLNVVGRTEYVPLFEDAAYRASVQAEIKAEAEKTLKSVGMLLVRCDVVIEPREPTGIFATPAIRERWEAYRQTVNAAERRALEATHRHVEEVARLKALHQQDIDAQTERQKQARAELTQATELASKSLAQKLRQEDARIAIEDEADLERKDREIGTIREEIARRAQELQLTRTRREGELIQEKKRQDDEFARLQRDQEQLQVAHERALAEKRVELLELEEQLSIARLELAKRKGIIDAENLEREVLAKGAHDIRMQQLLMQNLPAMLEQAGRAAEKVGEIRMLHLGGGNGADSSSSPGLAAALTSISTLPVVREMFQFLREFEQPSRSVP